MSIILNTLLTSNHSRASNQKAVVGMSVSEEKKSRSPISMKEQRLSKATKASIRQNKTFSWTKPRWSMKICQVCLHYIPKNSYHYESRLLQVACATCRLSFDFNLRKNKKDSCKHSVILHHDCQDCHNFKCASMGMSKRRILNGKFWWTKCT